MENVKLSGARFNVKASKRLDFSNDKVVRCLLRKDGCVGVPWGQWIGLVWI